MAKEKSYRGRNIPAWVRNPLAPEEFNGSLAWQVEEDFGAAELGRSYFSTEFFGHFNYKDYVLEYAGDYDSSSSQEVNRGDVIMTHDFLKHLLRLEVGDQYLKSFGQGVILKIGGVGVAKNYNLSPYFIKTPTGETELVLQRKSRVEVYVNDNLIRTLKYEAGKYLLKDLPLYQGINQIRLRIEDSLGEIKEVSLNESFSSQLLKKGLVQYNVQLGSFAEYEQGEIKYRTEKGPLLSGFFNRGFHRRWTAGGYGQAYQEQLNLGLKSILATNYVTLTTDFLTSFLKNKNPGVQIQLGFNRQFSKIAKGRSLTANLDYIYKSPYFTSLYSTQSKNIFSHLLQFNLGAQIGKASHVSLGLGRYYNRLGEYDRTNMSVYYNARVNRNIRLGLNMGRRRSISGESDSYVLFNFNLNFFQHKQNAYLFSDLLENTHQANWTYRSGEHDNSHNFAVTTNKEVDQNSEAFNWNYNHQNFEFRFDQKYIKPHDLSGRQRYNLQLASAVLFTKSEWAISRPVYNSYAIMVQNDELKDECLIFSSENSVQCNSFDLFSKKVIRNFNPYHYRKVSVDASRLTPGTSLNEESFVLFPTYKSAHHLKLFVKSHVMLIGRLMGARGTCGLATGHLRLLEKGKPTNDVFYFFSNRSGRIVVEDLVPGSYEIFFGEEEESVGELSIPQGKKGFLNVGSIDVDSEKCSN